MLKKAAGLTRPTPAVISPSHPESAKTDSSPWDAPFPKQGRSSAADPRFTFYGSWERCENAAGGLFQHPVSADTLRSAGCRPSTPACLDRSGDYP